MDRSLVLPRQSQGFIAAPGLQHGVTVVLQQRAGESSKRRFVLNYQNRRRTLVKIAHIGRAIRWKLFEHSRQVEPECRAASWLAVHPYVASALLYHAINGS